MGITLLVAEHMVAAVNGHPTDHRTFERHRTGHGQDDLERPVRLEAAMGEISVEPHRHPEAGKEVQNGG
jgi:hypothetical protein